MLLRKVCLTILVFCMFFEFISLSTLAAEKNSVLLTVIPISFLQEPQFWFYFCWTVIVLIAYIVFGMFLFVVPRWLKNWKGLIYQIIQFFILISFVGSIFFFGTFTLNWYLLIIGIGCLIWMLIWICLKRLIEIRYSWKVKEFLKATRVYILYLIPSGILLIAEFYPTLLPYKIYKTEEWLDVRTHIFFTAYVFSASIVGVFWLAESPWFHGISFIRRQFVVFRILVKYFFWEHPILFYGGLFYSFSLFCVFVLYFPSLNEIPFHDKVVIFDLWVISIASWLIPAFTCFWNFDRGVQDVYFRRMVSGTIRKFKVNEIKHKVFLGFGGLGKNVCEELLEREKRRDIKDTGYLMKCEKPGEKIYLRSDMVIVDRDESLFDDVFIDPALEKVGIAKVKYKEYKEYETARNNHNTLNRQEKEVWIPAVIGDVTNESVIDYCALKQSEFFVDTIKDYDEVIRISKFARQRENRGVKGIITVNDSAQKEMLFPRHSGEGVFLCYATHQQGITLGEVVYPDMANFFINKPHEKPKIMVFTDNLPQTQYMIETILQELKLSNNLEPRYLNSEDGSSNRKYVDLGISICSDHKEIKRVCDPHQPDYQTAVNLDIRKWTQLIERCANPKYAIPPITLYIESKVIIEKPRLINMEKIIDRPCLKPDIVVISYKDSARILQVLHEWMVAVERKEDKRNAKPNQSSERYKPKIIVGFRGEEHEEVRDYLQYYDTRFQKSSKFPVQAIDARVDLNRDSREHIGAIAEAMSSTRENRLDKGQIKNLKKNNEILKNIDPNDDKTVSLLNSAIGIHIIDRNRHGTMPGILKNLARLEFNREAKYDNYLKPSFHYSRYQNCVFGKHENYFLFTSNVILEKSSQEPYKPENDIGAALLSLPSGATEDIVNSFDELLKIKFGDTTEADDLMKECLFQVTCSPESYRRKVYNLEKNKDFFGNSTNKGMFGEDFRKNIEREKNRFYINTNFSYKDKNKDNEGKRNDTPLAKLYICCRHGNVPGALAVATNNMLFKKLDDDKSIGKEKLVFDITFLINYFSYSPDVIYKAIYGNLVSTDKQDRNELKDGVIECILICPITNSSDNSVAKYSWKNYVKDLCKFLGEVYHTSYKSIPESLNEDNRNPENILIYQEDKREEPCSIGHTDLNKKNETNRLPDSGCDICRKYCWTDGFKNHQNRS